MTDKPPLDVVFEVLDPSKHDITTFVCSKPPLHDYLRKHAAQNTSTGYSATTVALDRTSRQVLGYFSLCTASVMSAEMPPEDMKGMPRYPVPAILLAKMAVHLDVEGQGLGKRLVMLALREANAIRTMIGWRVFIVDAFDETVVPFYTRLAFKALPDNPLRLYISAKVVEKLMKAQERSARK